MLRRPAPIQMRSKPPRGLSRRLAAGLLVFTLLDSARGQSGPGIGIPTGESVLLTADPGGLGTYSTFLPGVGPGSTGIRYQFDLAWLTDESPSPGITHDSVFITLQSQDGLLVLPLFGIDVLGLQPSDLDGFTLEVEPLARPDPLLEHSLGFRVILSPPSDLLADGSWAVLDLVDTGPLGGSQLRVSLALVPEPGVVGLGTLGVLALLGGFRRFSRRNLR